MLPGLIFALMANAGVSTSADQPAQPRISLNVIVTDARGQRVTTLTAADFTVTENGRRVPVESARFVAATPARAAVEEAAPARLFAILLDDFHIAPGPAAEAARAALVQFVRDDLGPRDRVVVLRPLASLLTIALSADRAEALAAIAAFEPRGGDFTPRSEFERNFIAESPARVEATRVRIVTSAMNALATHLGQFSDTRKSLIVVSEGFVSGPPRRDVQVDLTLRSVAATANHLNVAIYTIAPQTPTPPTPASVTASHDDSVTAAREALRRLAADTGGLSFTTADVRPALLAVQADAAGFYVLTFRPSDDEAGGLEPVDVGVSRTGLMVRAQRAYGRPVRERMLPAPTAFLSAYSARVPRKSSPLIRPWFGLARGRNGDPRVSFVWEPSPRVPGDRTLTGAAARITMLVTTLEGEPVYQGVVLPATGSITGSGDGQRAVFEAPPGRLLVQLSIEDLSSRVLDRDVRDLVVRGFPGPVSLGTAELMRARNAREQQTLAGDPDATPVAARQFSRRERLIVRVPVYAAQMPAVSARLVSAYGNVMREMRATPVPGGDDLYQVDLPLSSFAAGAYTIDIEARTPEGVATDRLPISITP